VRERALTWRETRRPSHTPARTARLALGAHGCRRVEIRPRAYVGLARCECPAVREERVSLEERLRHFGRKHECGACSLDLRSSLLHFPFQADAAVGRTTTAASPNHDEHDHRRGRPPSDQASTHTRIPSDSHPHPLHPPALRPARARPPPSSRPARRPGRHTPGRRCRPLSDRAPLMGCLPALLPAFCGRAGRGAVRAGRAERGRAASRAAEWEEWWRHGGGGRRHGGQRR